MRRRPTGWYADPLSPVQARYWHEGWTDLVSWGAETRHDSTPLADIERAEARADAHVVADYLVSAVEHGVISPTVAAQIRDDLDRRVLGTPPPPVVPPPPVTPPPPTGTDVPLTGPKGGAGPAPVMPPPPIGAPGPSPVAAIPAEPDRLAQWWHEAHLAVRTDLAVHGFAYLGVGLLFAGVIGLIVFSFGGVAPWLRVLAELLVPVTMFIAAWLLHRRSAVVVSAALTILGGAILPVIVAATLTDGAPVPPDLSGRPLPIGQGWLVLTVAVAMGLVAGRFPSSPVRFLAVPVGWFAVGLAAGVFRDPVPQGADVARPDALQFAVLLGAIAATVAVSVHRRSASAITRAALDAALPVAGIAFVLEFVLAGDAGWPLAGSIVTGAATVIILELLSDRLPGWSASAAQFLVVGVTGARIAAHAEVAWVALGTALVLLALAEYLGRRRPAPEPMILGAGLASMAFATTLDDSTAAMIAFGTLAVWAVWRHVRPADWQPIEDRNGLVAAAAAAVATGALWDVAPLGPAVMGTAGTIMVVAVAGRWRQAIADDALWRWFVPASAIAITFATAGIPWGDLSIEVAIAAALAAGALALTTLSEGVRTWLAAPILIWSLANLGDAFDLDRNTQAIVLAVLGAALILISLAHPLRVGAHLAAIGHLIGIAALTVPLWPGWTATAVVATATIGWLVTTIADERNEAVHLAAFRASTLPNWVVEGEAASTHTETGNPTKATELAPLLSFAGFWATVILGADAAGWVPVDDPWAAAVTAGLAACATLVARAVPWRRARRSVLSWAMLTVAVAAVFWAISAAGADRDHWSPVVAVVLGLVVIGGAESPRPTGFVWVGWTGTAVLTGLVADRLGLGRDQADLVIAGWGATALLGALGAQRVRHGAVPPRSFIRDPLLTPPVVLGAATLTGGGLSGLVDGTDTQIGWTATALAAVVLAAAILIPLGALVAPAEALATVAYLLLAPWEPSDRPWTLAPWALILLIAARLTRRNDPPPATEAQGDETGPPSAAWWWAVRWDLPSFAVAHGVAGGALVTAIDADAVPATYALFALLSLSIAIVLRRWPWAVGGAVLALIAALNAGGGWPALVLAVEGVALSAIGVLRVRPIERRLLVGLGTVCLIGAWFDLAAWQAWTDATVFRSSVPGAAAVALVAAFGRRSARAPREVTEAWSVGGALVSLGVALATIGDVDRLSGGLTFAGSLLALAAAAGLLTPVFGRGMLWLAAGVAAVAWAPAAWAVEVSDTTATLVGTGVALVGAATVTYVHGRRPASAWLFPAAIYAAVTQAAAAVGALSTLPDRDLTIVVLLAASAELVAAGVIAGRPEIHVAAPVPACGAWLLFAGRAFAGEANWFTVPIGLTILVMVALLRWVRRGRGGDPTTIEIVVLDLIGMSFLVASGLARILGGALWYGLLTLAIGAALAMWGGLTRVRWRATFGALTVIVTLVLLIGVPLSEAVVSSGPALWLTLIGAGAGAIVVATLLENSRARARRIVDRVDALTEGWERLPWRRREPQQNESGSQPPAPREPPPPSRPPPPPTGPTNPPVVPPQ